MTQILVIERLLEELDHTPLRADLVLANCAHLFVSAGCGFTNLIRPVRSCCIRPCLMARVLSRRASSAAISVSMSDRVWEMAICSASGGKVIKTWERSFPFVSALVVYDAVATI